MKWSGGPIVAKRFVEGYRQIENCTPDILRNSVSGTELYKLEDYWRARPKLFFGMAIFIGSEEWVSPPIFPSARSYGSSWIVLDTSQKQLLWLTDHGEDTLARMSSRPRTKTRRSLPASVRFEVLRRDDFTCKYCGRIAPLVSLQVDHVVPLSRGGTDELRNLVAACSECNLGKSDKLLTKGL
jgi:hypothetical protein